MNIVAILTLFVLFAGVKAMILSETEDSEFDFPAFQEPDQEVDQPPGGCSGLIDCTEYIGKVLRSFVQVILYIGELILNLITFIIQLIVFIATITFSGIDDAPWYVNLPITFGPLLAVAIIGYKAIRKGDTDA